MKIPILLVVVAVLALLRFRRAPLLMWAAGWWIGIYVLLRFGFTAPIPASVVSIYMGIVSLAILAYMSSSQERREEISGPLVRLMTDKRYTAFLAAAVVAIPALAAANVYVQMNVPLQPPLFSRTVHPASPSEITVHDKKIDLDAGSNPFRHLETSNPAEFRQHVENGRRVYYRNCVFCHGDSLSGNGMFVHGLDPIPTNFADKGTIPMLRETFLFWRISKGGPGLPEEGGPWDTAMPAWEKFLKEETPIGATAYLPKSRNARHSLQFDSVNYWYWEHWKFFRHEVKTSIIQGIAVFLSLFEADPDVRRVFCPPKELYEGKLVESDPDGRVLPPFDELIESGKIIGLDFPVALNPALAKTIGTMMKIDYQRAVQLRIPRMEAETDRHYRPTVFICDEFQNFATVGGDNPVGDERFFSISRQPKCIPIVASQSVSSLKDALPNEGFKTLMQTFRTKVFLTTSDPDTARFASEICGKADRTKISYSVSESSNNAQVGWLSGHTSSNKGSVSASKHYQKSKEPIFDERVFFELKNAQSIVVAFDGIHPLPATYCYLKLDFLPTHMTWFEQERSNFDPKLIQRSNLR